MLYSLTLRSRILPLSVARSCATTSKAACDCATLNSNLATSLLIRLNRSSKSSTCEVVAKNFSVALETICVQ